MNDIEIKRIQVLIWNLIISESYGYHHKQKAESEAKEFLKETGFFK